MGVFVGIVRPLVFVPFVHLHVSPALGFQMFAQDGRRHVGFEWIVVKQFAGGQLVLLPLRDVVVGNVLAIRRFIRSFYAHGYLVFQNVVYVAVTLIELKTIPIVFVIVHLCFSLSATHPCLFARGNGFWEGKLFTVFVSDYYRIVTPARFSIF